MQNLISHEWIEVAGGSEKVLEQIGLSLPDSRLICLWNDDPTRFPNADETWLGKSPLRGHKIASMPLMGSAWKRADLDGVERVIASSHAFSHHLATRAAALGLPAFAYIHSPARYVWAPEVDNRGNSAIGRLGRQYFRWWDRKNTSKKVRYAANSHFVARRISDAWGIEASVVFPPVDIDRIINFEPAATDSYGPLPREYVLGASRFVPYKNLEAAIRAGEILGLPVVLVGDGPDEARLKRLSEDAQVPVLFTGRVSDDRLIELYRRAALFVYMPIEDFGIMPIEAIASGTPVLVNEIGGAREAVLAIGGGTTAVWRGSHFNDISVVESALRVDMSASARDVQQFSNVAFRRNFLSWLEIEHPK
jgi:glycosyltransferase involved in cell wall biosynthesis